MGKRLARTPKARQLGRYVGLRLHDLRNVRAVTQQELADRIGVSQGALSLYEHDLRDIPARALLAALHVLDCPPAEFFSGAPTLIVLFGVDAKVAAQAREGLDQD